jgi:hypothetical protein
MMAGLLASAGTVLGIETAAWAPLFVTIGNATQAANGTYLNAQKVANNLVSTSIVVQAANGVNIQQDPNGVDLSTSPLGTPHFDLHLVAPACNIDGSLNMAAMGDLYLTCATLNLNAPITSGGAPIDPSRVISTATHINVLSPAASIQQAIDISSGTSPVTIDVNTGTYAENLRITHPLTLSGIDGSSAGADPSAPTIAGTQSGGNVITASSNNVTADGLNIQGAVSGGSPSVDGIYASGVDSLTVAHNTFDNGFSGPAIATPGSSNVTLNANLIETPPAITSATSTVFTENLPGTFTVTTTGAPSPAINESGTLPAGLSFVDNGNGTATLGGTATATGTYPITLTATNGVSPDATQNLTLVVGTAPTINSASSTTFTVGSSGSFGVTTSGSPTPALSETGSMPPGVAFVDNGDGTATLAGTATTVGTYPITIAAINGVSPDASQGFTLTVGQISQTINFTSSPPGGTVVNGTPYDVTATGGASGNPVTFQSDSASICTVSGSTVSFVGAGICTVEADQAGAADYQTGLNIQSFSVGKGDQAVSFSSTAPLLAVVGGPTYDATASATSGLTPVITVDSSASSVCSISGSTVSFTGAGTCTLDADQAGDANFNAATRVQQSFSVVAAGYHVVTSSLPDATAGVAYSATITATGGHAPYTFKVTAGALPKGLKLASNGTITGIPKDIVATDAFTVTAKDTKTNGVQQVTTQDLSINVLQLAPVVAKVSKNFGPGAGGNTVTVKGLYMGYSTTPVTVLFGSVPATNVVVNSSGKSVTANAPAQAAGAVDVTVTTSWGTSTINVSDTYTYFGPTVTSVKPATGPDAGGTVITVKGVYFNGATQVLFGGVPGTNVVVAATGKALTVVSPAQGPGAVDIQVVTPSGTSATAPADTFTYP